MKKIIPAIFLFSAGSYAAAIPEAQLKEMWLSPKDAAEKLSTDMSFAEKLGQMLMVDIRSWDETSSESKTPFIEMNSNVSKMMTDYHLGSVILFRENLINTPKRLS